MMKHIIRLLMVGFGIYFGINLGYMSLSAQSGGQFCVRSYQDSNGNGVLDAESEPLITRGIGIELLDNRNVIIASAVLDRSPNAADGVICFQNLSDGDYAVLMSSAEFTATTPRLISRTVSATGLPVVIEFGAQRIGGSDAVAVTTAGMSSPEQMQAMIMRLSLSTVGAVLVMVLFLLIGVFVYILRMRGGSPAPQSVNYRPESTLQPDPGSIGATPPRGMSPVIPEPPIDSLADTGRVQVFNDDD